MTIAQQMNAIANNAMLNVDTLVSAEIENLLAQIRDAAKGGSYNIKWHRGKELWSGSDLDRLCWDKVVEYLKAEGFHVDSERSGGASFISWRIV